MATEETWRPLYDWEESHRVSNHGSFVGTFGYPLKINVVGSNPSQTERRVSVRTSLRAANLGAARYLLYSFSIFPQDEKEIPCYWDGDPGNLRLENLYWGKRPDPYLARKPCSVGGCPQKVQSRGMCVGHYLRSIKGQDLDKPLVSQRPGEWGAWRRTPQGYVRRCRKFPSGVREEQLQHRLVLEELLKRPLLPQETVHHINGVRDDNRVENLELWSSSHPPGQRVEDKVAWATELLRLYAPERLKDSD